MYVNVYFKLTCIVLQLNILICTLSNYILLQLKDTILLFLKCYTYTRKTFRYEYVEVQLCITVIFILNMW